MSCEELRDHYEMYALGVLEDPERAQIWEHVDRRCEVCMEGLDQARQLLAVIGSSVASAEPSPRLRKRILASVGIEEPRRFGWTPWWIAATALCLVGGIYFAGRERDYANELARTRSQMREQTIELTRLNEAFAILNGADTTEAVFGQDQKTPPRGKVFVSPAAGVLLVASNLPPAPAGKIYEMWVIPKSGKPVPAGLFQTEGSGAAMHIQRGAVDVDATAAVAVTLENEGGAPQPTSQPLIVAGIARRAGG